MLNDILPRLPKDKLLAAAYLMDSYDNATWKVSAAVAFHAVDSLIKDVDEFPDKVRLVNALDRSIELSDIPLDVIVFVNTILQKAAVSKTLSLHFDENNDSFAISYSSVQFSDSDIKRMQVLLDDIREIIHNSTEMDDEHKDRLYFCINTLVKEIFKKKSSYHKVLENIVELSVAIGAVGENIKPITDRVRELAGIAKKTNSAPDQLESPEEVKQLPAPDDECEE